MRVIAGSARRIQLKTIDGMDTRPTTDRIKETLFNMITPYLLDCRFLDFFSGSGAIGIEALSRGAKKAYFVEQNPRAAACIRENLKKTKLEDGAVVMQTDVLSAIARLDGEETFDYIFMDPPYRTGAEFDALKALKGTSLLNEETVIIIEAALETEFADAEKMGYRVIKEKKYKTNKHIFLERH